MAVGDLDAPVIPLLINNTIDPQHLNGGPLNTYAKYDNPRGGDVIYQSWLGRKENGDPVDIKDTPIFIDPSTEGELGFLMTVANDLVVSLNKGQVFYSFYLERANGDPREESKRIHFGVGPVGWLSAPQIKESHDNQLDLDALKAYAMLAIVPYNVMSNGDKVRVIWKGTKADGSDGSTVNLPVKTLSDTDTDRTNNPGQVLSWDVPKANFSQLRGGSVTLHYEITHASSPSGPVTVSTQRTLLITAPIKPVLAAPSVKDLTGTEINPGQFPNGIRVVIAAYPDIRVGDDVLVYGTGSGANKHTIQFLKIDSSNIETGLIELPISNQWLLDNRGSLVSLRFQYARADASGSSVPLELNVREPLVLPPPTVDASVVIANRTELDPIVAISGALITLPTNVIIGEGDTVIAYWKGFDDKGSYEVTEPSQLNPMKFKVPPTVIPSNFNRTVEVTYSVSGQMAKPSLALYIQPLRNHPSITCEGAQVGSPATLKLSDIPGSGALVKIGKWPFISTEQAVRLWLTAGGIGERDLIAVRNVLPDEVTGGVSVRLLNTQLAGIALNSTFSLRASVSFDGGNTTTLFNKILTLKLVA